MDFKVFEISSKGIIPMDTASLEELEKDQSKVYFVDIHSVERESIKEDLRAFGILDEIVEGIQSPFDHIRFDYYNETLYGELAIFSPSILKEQYASLIIQKNVLIVIHPENANILNHLNKSIQTFKSQEHNKISLEVILYSLILENLSNYGKLILSYRDEIEELALEMDKKGSTLSASDIWDSKTESTTFQRVLDKLFYTLSFPPTKAFIDAESPYLKSFDYLLKNLDLLKSSLKQVEDRLDSLNDHYQLVLQAKSNKRLNVLTIVQAIFVPLTLVVGVYGMNFTYIPELEIYYGYYYSLVGMALISAISLFFFYRNGWFDH